MDRWPEDVRRLLTDLERRVGPLMAASGTLTVLLGVACATLWGQSTPSGRRSAQPYGRICLAAVALSGALTLLGARAERFHAAL